MTKRKPLTWHNKTDRILGTVAVAHADDGARLTFYAVPDIDKNSIHSVVRVEEPWTESQRYSCSTDTPSGYEAVTKYLPREQWDQTVPDSNLAPELLHVIEQAGNQMRSRRLARDHRVILQWRELPFTEVGHITNNKLEHRLQSARTTRLELTIPYVEPRKHGEPTDAPQWLQEVSAGLVHQSWSQPPEHWQERKQMLQDLMRSTEEGLLRRVHLSHEDVAGRYLDGQWEEEKS